MKQGLFCLFHHALHRHLMLHSQTASSSEVRLTWADQVDHQGPPPTSTAPCLLVTSMNACGCLDPLASRRHTLILTCSDKSASAQDSAEPQRIQQKQAAVLRGHHTIAEAEG